MKLRGASANYIGMQEIQNRQNIFLIGFMGVGKTVVGRSLARSLRMEFVDSDYAIERSAGKSIKEIFEEDGEEAFRAMERRFIEEQRPGLGMVVSCGGGLPVRPGMPEMLKDRGLVICLFASPSTIVNRTLGNPKRPLLNVENPEQRIRELLEEREKVYMNTGIGVSTEGRTIHEVVGNIIRIYRRQGRGRPGRRR